MLDLAVVPLLRRFPLGAALAAGWLVGVAACAALAAQSPSQTHDLQNQSGGPTGRPLAVSGAEPEFQLPETQNAIGMFERADGTLAADGRAYHANFDERGATLLVRDPRDDQQSATLTLRLASWRRGIVHRPIEPVAVSRSGADMARFEHTGITERYQLTATGFEQSFVLEQRPAGHGDLVLEITATGPELRADALPLRQQAIEFCVGEQPTFRYGEAVAFSRGSAERVPVATRYDGNGRIELVVAAEFLDAASYPVIIDPAVGPSHFVSLSGFNDLNADVAYDPVADTFMVVWQREFSVNDKRIRVQRYTRDGAMISGIGPLTGSGFATWPTVGYVPAHGFYVVWSHSTGLRGQLLNSSGTGLLSAVHQLTTVPLGTRDLRAAFSVRGVEILLAWDRTPNGSASPQSIMARRCAMTVASMPPISLGSELVVETASGGYVQRVRMPRTHIFAGGPQTSLCWERFYTTPAPGDFDVRIARAVIGAGSMTFVQAPTNMPSGAAIGVNERRPDVAAIDHPTTPRMLFVWEDAFDIEAQRYDIFGPVGGTITVRATSNWESGPAVGAGSSEFSVGYLSAPQSQSAQQDVYAARVLSDGTVLAPHSPVNTLNGPLQRGLRASSVTDSSPNEPNGVMFSWLIDSDSIGVINDIYARLYEPVTSFVSPYGTACAGPGGTLPTIGTDGTPYPGNLGFGVTLSNAPSGTLAALMINDTLVVVPIPGAPGCTLYVDFPVVLALPTVTSATGDSVVSVPIPAVTPSGVLLGFQWAVLTPGHNAFGWITSQNLDISWQQ